MSKQIGWPHGAKFAFSIFDDTDNATVENCKPVYDYLIEKGVLTTKSVWAYQPRGNYSGDSLSNPAYLAWIKSIRDAGVEIALHGVGDGEFSRDEIVSGFEKFKEELGSYPRIHCNHVSNPDNLYWWGKRFVWPISFLYRVSYLLRKRKPVPVGGEAENSRYFWGDLAKQHIRYVRNLTFSDVNTLRCDPQMPWYDAEKPYVNSWFSSSDGHNATLFNTLLTPKKLDQLEAEGGACIVYTHFASGFVDAEGNLDPTFKERIDDLASRNGWFVPCGQLLDYLSAKKSSGVPGYWYRLSRNIKWILDRLQKFIKHRM